MRWLFQDTCKTILILSVVSLKAILLFAALPLFLRTFAGDYNAGLFPDDYDSIAWSLASGEGYRLSADTAPTMLRSPGFVLVLAAVFACFGKSLLAVQILNFAFSLVAAYVVFLLTTNLFGDRRVALVAAGFSLFYPASFIAESRGGLESFLTLCMALTFLLAYRAERIATYRAQIVMGISFGLTVLTKASVALMMPAFWLYRLVSKRSLAERKSSLLRYAIAGVVAALIQVPWIVRNYDVSGEFVATMTSGGITFDQGRYIISNYTFSKAHRDLVQEADERDLAIAKELGFEFEINFFPRFYRSSDEVMFYRHLRDGALKDYRDSPSLLGKALLINSLAFWFQGRSHAATIVNVAVALPVLVSFCFGIVIARRRGLEYGGTLVALAAFIAPHLLIISTARYHAPIVPLLAPFVALCWTSLFARQRRPADTEVRGNELPRD